MKYYLINFRTIFLLREKLNKYSLKIKGLLTSILFDHLDISVFSTFNGKEICKVNDVMIDGKPASRRYWISGGIVREETKL